MILSFLTFFPDVLKVQVIYRLSPCLVCTRHRYDRFGFDQLGFQVEGEEEDGVIPDRMKRAKTLTERDVLIAESSGTTGDNLDANQ